MRLKKGISMWSGDLFLNEKKIYMRSGNRRILRYYFKSYFIILLIPLIISSIYYMKSIKVIKENAVLESEAALSQMSQILEKQLDIMYECCDVAVSNYYVRLFGSFNQTDKTAKPFDILNLQRNIPNYSGTSELISNFYIFFNNSGMVINNSIAYSFSDFYKLSWHREGEGWEEWQKERKDGSDGYYRLHPCQQWVNGYTNEKTEKLSFLYPLPSYSGKGGSVLLLIDKETMADIVAPGNTDDSIWYIQNSSGEILIHSLQPHFPAEDISRAINEKYPVKTNLHGSALVWTTEGTALDGGTPRYATLGVPDEIDWGSYGFDKSYTNYKWISASCFENFNNEFRGDLQIDNPATNIEAILQKAAESYAKYSPADETMIPNITFAEEDATKITDYALTIGGYVNQAAVQFITGSLDIEKDWDDYVKKLEDMGLADYVQIVQKSYDIYNENLQ